MFFLSAALADTIRVPDDQATVSDAVYYAGTTNGPDEIVVSASYVPADKAVDVGDQTITFAGAAGRYEIEPLFGQGATLDIRDAAFTVTDDWSGSPFARTTPCSLCVRLGSVNLSDVTFESAKGYGIIIVDTDMFASGLSMSDGRDGHALASLALTESVILEVSEATFYQNVGGAVKLYGDYGYEVDATFNLVDFVSNVSDEGATIYARNANISVVNGEQSGNVARSTSPLDFEGTSATFDGVEFDGNSGLEGNLIKANLASSDVSFLGGTVHNGAGSFGDAFVFGGGKLSFVDVDWTPQGVLQVNESMLNISGGTWTVGGEYPGIIYGVDSDISWRGSTICGVGVNALEFKGILRGNGGALRFENNVVQSVISNTDGLIRGGGLSGEGNGPSIEMYDNTIVGTRTTSLIDGEATYLSFVNNIVMNSIGSFGMAAWPSVSQGEFNIYYDSTPESTGAAFPAGWSENDLIGVDPKFLSTFDPSICGDDPLLRTGSPAIDAGSPDRTDDYGVGASDIGAFDGGNGEDVDDTGEPSDTGANPNENDDDGDGTPNAADCAPLNSHIHPNAVDINNDGIDQNCNGSDADLSYGGGCQGFALQLAGLSLWLYSPLRRRR